MYIDPTRANLACLPYVLSQGPQPLEDWTLCRARDKRVLGQLPSLAQLATAANREKSKSVLLSPDVVRDVYPKLTIAGNLNGDANTPDFPSTSWKLEPNNEETTKNDSDKVVLSEDPMRYDENYSFTLCNYVVVGKVCCVDADKGLHEFMKCFTLDVAMFLLKFSSRRPMAQYLF